MAKKLKGVVMTASPGPMPAPAMASQRASVPLAQPTAWGTPQVCAAACSKRVDLGAEDEALGGADGFDGFKEFLAYASELTGEIKHRNWLRIAD